MPEQIPAAPVQAVNITKAVIALAAIVAPFLPEDDDWPRQGKRAE